MNSHLQNSKSDENLAKFVGILHVLFMAWFRIRDNQNFWRTIIAIMSTFPTRLTKDVQELFCKLFNDVQNIHEELVEYINNPSSNRLAFSNHDDDDDDDEDYTIAITPEEPDNSLSMGDKHLDTIPATKLDEEFSDPNDDSTSIDDNYFSIDNIDYVEASPLDSEIVSLEEVKDDNLREKLLNINLLIVKIKSLNDNPTPDHMEPDQGELTSVVMKDNLIEPRVHVPNVLTTHPTHMLDSDFIPSDNSLPESEIFYFDIEEKNSGSELISIVDSGIRENILSATNVNLPPEEDHSPLFAYVVWIFLSFLTYPVIPPYRLPSRNEDTIFDHGISNYHFPSLLLSISHRFETFMKFNVYPKLLNESPMKILSSTCSPKDQ
nr:hypothetical protein [Tanacetum cinerariifolium]